MALQPGEDIGLESQATHDQFFRIEKGKGKVEIDGVTHKVKGGDGIVVPAGARHNLTNTGDTSLRLYTIYGLPNHVDHLTPPGKSDALASHEVFDGVASEWQASVRAGPPATTDRGHERRIERTTAPG